MSIEILPTTCSTSLRESSTYLQECEIRLTSHPCSSAGKFHHNETSRHPQEASVCCRPLENLLLISLHWSSSGVNQAIVHTLCQTPVLLPRCFFSESSSTRGKINIGCGQIQIEVIWSHKRGIVFLENNSTHHFCPHNESDLQKTQTQQRFRASCLLYCTNESTWYGKLMSISDTLTRENNEVECYLRWWPICAFVFIWRREVDSEIQDLMSTTIQSSLVSRLWCTREQENTCDRAFFTSCSSCASLSRLFSSCWTYSYPIRQSCLWFNCIAVKLRINMLFANIHYIT